MPSKTNKTKRCQAPFCQLSTKGAWYLWICYFCLWLFLPAAYSQEAAERLTPYSVVIHVHSDFSGEDTTVEEISHLARQKGVDAVIITDYFQQKASIGIYPWHRFLKISFQRPSVKKRGIKSYYDQIALANQKVPEVILIPGLEVTPFYWWGGDPWKENWTIYDLQKNLLVFGLDAEAAEKIPTIENARRDLDPYHGRMGEIPYQDVMDYVNEQGGFSMWSTPDEAFGSELKWGPVHLSTLSYTDSLPATRDYSGVGIYPEGYIKTGAVGGVWDNLLMKYCRGSRERPFWAFAESVAHDTSKMRQFQKWDNVVLAESKTQDAILGAMRKGRFYIRTLKRGKIFLAGFQVTDAGDPDPAPALMGEEIEILMAPRIRAAVALSRDVRPMTLILQIVKNGEIAATLEAENEIEVDWTDPKPETLGGKGYYRLVAMTRPEYTGSLVSNPIFVSRREVEKAPA